MLVLGLCLCTISITASALAIGLGLQRVERRIDAMADLMGLPPERVAPLPTARAVQR